MKFRKWAAVLAAAATVLTACGGDDDSNGSDNNDSGSGLPDKIVLGLVPSQEADQLVEDASALADLLAEELGVEVESTISDNYTALVVAMQTGQADVGMFGPIALVQAADQAGATVTLQSIRRGTASYHTQWFTNEPDRFCDGDVVKAENAEGNTFSYCNGTDTATEGPDR